MPRRCARRSSFPLECVLTENVCQYVGFWLSFTLPTAVFFLAPIVLLIGRNRYVRSPPQGSVLPSALRILRYSLRGTASWNPVQFWRNIHVDGFWDKSKPSVVEREGINGKEGKASVKPMWMTYDDQWVDEVRRGFKACTVFVWYPIYCMSWTSLHENPLKFVLQGSLTTK